MNSSLYINIINADPYFKTTIITINMSEYFFHQFNHFINNFIVVLKQVLIMTKQTDISMSIAM